MGAVEEVVVAMAAAAAIQVALVAAVESEDSLALP